MANIITHGKTPKWGIEKNTHLTGVILDSYNESVEIKDYEQTDEKGAVCGYLVYDQTRSFDMSGTLIAGKNLPTCLVAGNSIECLVRHEYFSNFGHNCELNSPRSAILKNISFSANAGGAQTFSASGTIYDFSDAN